MWILVAEDETSMAEVLRQGLEEDNHTVTLAQDGSRSHNGCGYQRIRCDRTGRHDAGVDEIRVARQLRREGNQVPILMLTARDTSLDVINDLDAGADDYLVKPFVLGVLLARLRALARRASQPQIALLQVNDLVLDPASRTVMRESPYSAHSYGIPDLEFLLRRTDRAASRASSSTPYGGSIMKSNSTRWTYT